MEGVPSGDLTDIPLLEQTPEEQERQPDLGPEENERVYLKPAALVAYTTAIKETVIMCKEVLASQDQWRVLSCNDASVLYELGDAVSRRRLRTFILRGHLSKCDKLVDILYKMPHAGDPLVRRVSDGPIETCDDYRVTQWETHHSATALAWFGLGYKHWSGISVASRGDSWVTHRIIPSHRHQLPTSLQRLMDGYFYVSLKPGEHVTTITCIFACPMPSKYEAFFIEQFQGYLGYLEHLQENN